MKPHTIKSPLAGLGTGHTTGRPTHPGNTGPQPGLGQAAEPNSKAQP
ncbi:hypothetical protein ACWCV9_11385 [Streptomyces sp. NPDC001606]